VSSTQGLLERKSIRLERHVVGVLGATLERHALQVSPALVGVQSAWVMAALRLTLHPLLTRGPVHINTWLDALLERGAQAQFEALLEGLLERSQFCLPEHDGVRELLRLRLPAYRWLDAETVARPPWVPHSAASSLVRPDIHRLELEDAGNQVAYRHWMARGASDQDLEAHEPNAEVRAWVRRDRQVRVEVSRANPSGAKPAARWSNVGGSKSGGWSAERPWRFIPYPTPEPVLALNPDGSLPDGVLWEDHQFRVYIVQGALIVLHHRYGVELNRISEPLALEWWTDQRLQIQCRHASVGGGGVFARLIRAEIQHRLTG
jgi:hypothetical protein